MHEFISLKNLCIRWFVESILQQKWKHLFQMPLRTNGEIFYMKSMFLNTLATDTFILRQYKYA